MGGKERGGRSIKIKNADKRDRDKIGEEEIIREGVCKRLKPGVLPRKW